MALGKRLINTGGAAAACSTDSVQAFGADAAFSSNIALYQLDGNANDTTTNYDGVASSGLTYSTGLFGQAASFDGTDNILLPTGSPFNDSNTIKAVSFWVKADTSTSRVFPFSISSTTNTNDYFYIGYLGDLNRIYVAARDGSSSNQNQRYSTITSDTNWNHFVAQLNGSTVEIWMNGIQLTVVDDISGTATSSSWISYPSYSGTVRGAIGVLRLSTPQYSNGQIDQVRIFDRAITPEEVSTLYNETTSTASNTNPLSDGSGVALYSLDYDASDAGGLYDGTPTNVDFGVDGQINYAARFNGSSSYIDITGILSGITNVFSYSAWFKITNSSKSFCLIDDGSGGSSNLIQFIPSHAGGSYFITFGSTANRLTGTRPSSIVDGNWHHMVVTKSSSNLSFYIDKVLIQEDTSHTDSVSGLSNAQIAKYSANYSEGSIDQVRIFSKALNQSEVDTLFDETACVYTSTTDIVNYPTGTTPIAYYKLDNSSEDYSTGGNDGTDTNIEYRFGRFGQAAVFNGSSSYINLNSAVLPASVFSVSFWVNVNSLVNEWVFSQYTGGVTGRFIFNITSTGGFQINVSSTNSLSTTNIPAITIGNWHHVVVVKDGSNGWTLYSDGSSHSTWNSSENIITNQNTILGGDDSVTSNNLDGKLDQVRIYDAALTSSQVTELYNEKPEVDTSDFKAVLYEGTGSTQYISNVGMDLETSGGLIWTKRRTGTSVSHAIVDSLRTIAPSNTGYIASDTTDLEQFSTNMPSSLEANGFFVQGGGGRTNTNNEDYVSWVWKGGGDAVPNTQGTNITSSVSANTAAGFSIVKWTGDADASSTIGHGLSPNSESMLVIIKDLDSSNDWMVMTNDLWASPTAYYLKLNLSAGLGTGTGTPYLVNNTVFKNTNRNTNGNDYIAYCFHSVAGYSKIGTYEGDTTTPPNVNLGFEPRWILIKKITTAASFNHWYILDAVRDTDGTLNKALMPSLPNQEATYTSDYATISTNGFTPNGGFNTNGVEHLYMAFK